MKTLKYILCTFLVLAFVGFAANAWTQENGDGEDPIGPIIIEVGMVMMCKPQALALEPNYEGGFSIVGKFDKKTGEFKEAKKIKDVDCVLGGTTLFCTPVPKVKPGDPPSDGPVS